MDLKMITWDSQGNRLGERELSKDISVFLSDGELKFSINEREEGFRFLFQEKGIRIINYHRGLNLNGEFLLPEHEIQPIRKLQKSLSSSLNNIIKNFSEHLPIPIHISEEVQYISEIKDGFSRFLSHYRKLNTILHAINDLTKLQPEPFEQVRETIEKADIFDEYSRRDNRNDLLSTLIDLKTQYQLRELMLINSHLKEIEESILQQIEHQLNLLSKENQEALNDLPSDIYHQHPSLKKDCRSFDEIVKYFSSILQEHRRIGIIDPGDMIHLDDLVIEINHISPFPNQAQWETPFDNKLTYQQVDQLLSSIKNHESSREAMATYVEENVNIKKNREEVIQDVLLELESNLPEIRNILRYDSRILEFNPGQNQVNILCNFGDFGNTAYYIVEGEVEVLLNKAQLLELQKEHQKRVQKKSFWQAISQFWKNRHHFIEWRPKVATSPSLQGHTLLYHQDVENVIESRNLQKVTLGSGQLIGEISAMGRTPRNATILVPGKAKILEIRWQGLRDLRNQCSILKKITDANFRARGMDGHLRASELFKHLNEEERKYISSNVEFFSYGSFDWNTSYKDLMQKGIRDTIDNEPVLIKEGQYPDGIFMIRSGFARVSKLHNHGHKTISYIGKGAVFGLEECLHNLQNPEQEICFQHSLRAIGYVDTILIPKAIVKKYLFDRPEAQKVVQKHLNLELNSFGPKMDQSVLEEVVLRRTINGQSGMMIDMDRCTRCDDCLHACASAHDGNPRFLRQGPMIDNLMIANACMHCHDPVCMIGCPTGAIHRNIHGGQVLINDMTCIGCSTCANSCPYGNIRMVNISDQNGRPKVGEDHELVQKATKCDLCVDQLGGPSCERACPHDALKRMDFVDIPNFERWVKEHHAS